MYKNHGKKHKYAELKKESNAVMPPNIQKIKTQKLN